MPSESQPERNVPPPSHRRKPAAYGGTLRMPARDERAICGVERARREGTGTTGSPWNAANRALVTASRQVMSGMTRIRW